MPVLRLPKKSLGIEHPTSLDIGITAGSHNYLLGVAQALKAGFPALVKSPMQ